MSNQDGEFGAFFVGFIIGGLVGAAAALLLAPQSGEETRTIILEKSTEIKDKTAQSATQAMESARVRADELAASAKQKADDLQARSQAALHREKTESVELPAEDGGEETATA
jgi:gas vesicle protein